MANAWIMRPLPLGTITSSRGTLAGHGLDNLGNDFIGVTWKPASYAPSVHVKADLGADVAVDAALFLGTIGDFVGRKIETTVTTAGGTVWTAPTVNFLAGSEMPTNGLGVGWWEASAGAPAAAQQWQFNFSSMSGTTPEIGRWVLGKRIRLARNFSFGAAFGVRDLGTVDFSPRGVLLRRRGAKLRVVGLSFASINKDEVDAAIQPLLELIGNTEPIALVIDPAADAMRQRRAYYGFLTGDVGTVQRRAGAWQWNCNLVSLI